MQIRLNAIYRNSLLAKFVDKYRIASPEIYICAAQGGMAARISIKNGF